MNKKINKEIHMLVRTKIAYPRGDQPSIFLNLKIRNHKDPQRKR